MIGEKCKQCDGFGWYSDTDRNGEQVQVHCDDCYGTGELQICGHPMSARIDSIDSVNTYSYCGICADESLRKNINEGVEA